MKELIASAPGKFYFFGEHAAVYGIKSIAFAIDQRMYCTVKERSDKKVILNFPDLGVSGWQYDGKLQSRETAFVTATINRLSARAKISGVELTTKSEMKAGFGTSSSSVVAAIGALNELFGLGLSKEEIFRTGYQAVIDVQGTGSGYDIACATYGGMIEYVKGNVPKPIPYPKNIPLVVGYTGIKADTVKLVKQVAALKEKHPEHVRHIFSQIEKIVNGGEKALAENDVDALGELMNQNHGLLVELNVSSPELEKLIAASNGAGAIGAKLSGAGGGDCMLALAPGKTKEVSEAIKSAGGTPFPGIVGEGLRVEKK